MVDALVGAEVGKRMGADGGVGCGVWGLGTRGAGGVVDKGGGGGSSFQRCLGPPIVQKLVHVSEKKRGTSPLFVELLA